MTELDTESGCSTNARDAPLLETVRPSSSVTTTRFCPSGVYYLPLAHNVSMTADGRQSGSSLSRADILDTFRTTLLGPKPERAQRAVLLSLALGLFGVTFLAYELDIFSHSGGVVFIPFHAALVGVAAAFWTGYSRTGLLAGWLLTYLSFLGWRAEWATEISPRPLTERIAYIVRPDGLAALAIIGVGVSVIGFTAGALVRNGVDALRTEPQTATDT